MVLRAKGGVIEPPKPKLGRPGNTLKMGIVGLPNVGKSTTFNILSKQQVPAENYPFCTIEPNLAQVCVPDDRFDHLVDVFKPKSIVQAVLRIQDIAGLVPGASKGEGLGNAFLSHIRETDGIYQVVRAFEDVDIMHTEAEVDPVRDLQIIHDELLYKDQEFLNKQLDEVEPKFLKYPNDKVLAEERELLLKLKELMIDNKKWVIKGDWKSSYDIEYINKFQFLTAKPCIYLVNLSKEDFLKKKNKWLPKIKGWIDANLPGDIIPYSADYEKGLLSGEEKGETPSMLPKIIKTGYKILDLIYFFTAGEDEVRAWTLKQGKKAPQAAGVIHTDFERGFICAEIMKYVDFVESGDSETKCKDNGKYHQKGKDYEVLDGDIIFFKFNVSSSGKKK